MSTTSKIGPSAIYGALETLNLKPGATGAEIKAAFRKGALRNHPDKTHDPATAGAFQAIVDAHATLENAGYLGENQPALPSRQTRDTRPARDVPRSTRPAPSTTNRTSAYNDKPPPPPPSRTARRSESTRRNSHDRPSKPAEPRPSPKTRPPPTSYTYTIPTTPPPSRPSSHHGKPRSRSERRTPREVPIYADNILPSQRPTMSQRHTDQPAYRTEIRVPPNFADNILPSRRPSMSQRHTDRPAYRTQIRVPPNFDDTTLPSQRPAMSHRHTHQPAYVTELRVPPNDPSRLHERIPRPEPLASVRRSLARSNTDYTPVARPQSGKTKVYEKETYHYSTKSGKKKRVTVETFY